MLHSRVFEKRIPLRKFAPALFLVSSSIVWYVLTNYFLTKSLPLAQNEYLLVLGAYYAGIAVAAFVGTMVFRRSRVKWLSLWMLFGVAMTALLSVSLGSNFSIDLSVSLVFGISTGVGLPSCLAYFGDATSVENRGTYGGFTWGTIGLFVLALLALTSNLTNAQSLGVLAIWRLFGFMAFYLASRKELQTDSTPHTQSYKSILERRDMILYLLPWVLFSLVNFAEAPILQKSFGNAANLSSIVEVAISGAFALVGGFLADTVGRKRVAIMGFILLGLEYAFLSLFSTTQATLYVYTLFDGVAWGMFAAVFFMTMWGDLAQDNQKERYYLLGGLPYLLASFLSALVKPFIGANFQTSAAFSLASFFLFLAMLPLIYAPETLSEKRIKEMELKTYLEKAKKVKEKYA
ncbi:MAG: MFS transporter [Candidatus Bathyarchaeia archaeon]|jgi:MFS family permease